MGTRNLVLGIHSRRRKWTKERTEVGLEENGKIEGRGNQQLTTQVKQTVTQNMHNTRRPVTKAYFGAGVNEWFQIA